MAHLKRQTGKTHDKSITSMYQLYQKDVVHACSKSATYKRAFSFFEQNKRAFSSVYYYVGVDSFDFWRRMFRKRDKSKRG